MTPLLRVVLAYLAGLLPGLLLPALAPGHGWPVPAAAALVVCAGAGLIHARHRQPYALLLYGALGVVAGLLAVEQSTGSCAARLRHGEAAVLRGYLESEPVPGRSTPFRAVGGCAGRFRVQLQPAHQVAAGEPLELSGRWLAFEAETRWPVPAHRRGMLRVREASAWSQGPGAGGLLRARLGAQRAFRSALPRQHGVAEALVLAQRDGLDPGIRDAFVAAGMAHLLAISGSHVLVFAGALLLLLRIVRLPPRVARCVAVLLICGYVLALGAVPPAMRAALQFALLSAAVLLQRPAHAWTLLGAAALALLVLEPLNAVEVGFQLSFAGVAGLLALRRPLLTAFPRRVPRLLAEPLATGLAATAATAPIAALHFGQFAPIGLLASVVAGPLLGLALPALALLLLVYPLAPGLAAWLGGGVELLLRALLAVADHAAAVPGGHFAVAASTVLAGLAAAAVLLMAGGRHSRAVPVSDAATPLELLRARRQLWIRRARATAVLAAALVWTPAFAPGADGLELHAIDVGQGDAVAIRTPRNRWILVDAGMRTDRSDMGARRVVPYLLARGVRRVDLLVLTHPHADHIGGAVAVFRAFDVGTVVDPGAAAASRQYIETLQAARAEPARWIAPRAGGEVRLDGVRLRFLHPRARSLDAPPDPNDLSVVFRLTYGRFAALFTGDATERVEADLLAAHGPDLAAAVLKVGHHGSRTSSRVDFLEAVDPRLALISVGRDNRYGHPSPDVLARLLRQGVSVLRTDERGSIRLRAWRSGEFELATQR